MFLPGYVGGKWTLDHEGSGSNYMCLPTGPNYLGTESGKQGNRGLVYSGEYKTSDFTPLEYRHDYDAPCTVCSTIRSGVLMIPAKTTCPSGWTVEYFGYLMSASYKEKASQFVCVDENPDYTLWRSHFGENGVLLYPVEARCSSNNGNLPCDAYPNGAELTCVVCTKWRDIAKIWWYT